MASLSNNLPKIAVIGCGAWGKNHVRVLREFGCLKYVHDENPEAFNGIGPVSPASLDIIWADPEIKGVVIATPPVTHSTLAHHAATFNKAILIEKPMALRRDESASLAHYALDRGSLLMVGHLMCYHEGFRRAKGLVGSGEIGDVEYIYSSRLQCGKVRTIENSLWSLSPHDFSMIISIAGKPQILQSFGSGYRQHGIADSVLATMQFESGARGHVFVSWMHPYKERKLVIAGTKGTIVFDDSKPVWGVMVYDLAGKLTQVHGPTVETEEPLVAELKHFLHCIETRRPPLTGAKEGLAVVEALEACAHEYRIPYDSRV